MIYGKILIPCFLALAGVIPVGTAIAAPGDKANVSGLSDASFGVISAVSDQTLSQNVCAYSSGATNRYSVFATGSGPGGSFALSSSAALLSYDLLWNDAVNQSGGTSLIAGAAHSGFVSAASQKTCNSGPSSSASLSIVLRGTVLASAEAGSYVGTLQITIAPE